MDEGGMKLLRNRNDVIVRYNIIGVVLNLSLTVLKLITGTLFHSHAVILDGVNSLSDLVSEIFSIISAQIGSKSADASHPFGYGRLEYISSLMITVVILFVGGKSIVDSVTSILNPHEPPIYSPFLITIMVISLLIKAVYGIVMKRKGRELGSAAMVMTGTDSLGDALVAMAILFSAAVYRFTGTDIEHYLCILISLLIIRTGVEMFFGCMNKIIGTRVDPELRKKIIRMLIMENGVLNVSNLVIHNYGEGVNIGSVDIEVDEQMKAAEINVISRNIKHRAKELGVTITSVGVTGINVSSPEAERMWDTTISTILRHKSVNRAQGFTVDLDRKAVSFTVVEDTSIKNRQEDMKELLQELQAEFPDMKVEIDTAPL